MSEQTPQMQNSQEESFSQNPAGSDLLNAQESYKADLSENELESVSGGATPTIALTVSVISPPVIGVAKGVLDEFNESNGE